MHASLCFNCLLVAVCSAAYNLTCLREITFFLIGSRLVERSRNLTVPRFFERQQQNSANGNDGDPHRYVTGTCRHVMEKHCRTDHQCENSCIFLRTTVYYYCSYSPQSRNVSPNDSQLTVHLAYLLYIK